MYNRSVKDPETLVEAIRMFSDPDVAFRFMCELRWPNGPVCPICGCDRYSFLKTRRTFKCKNNQCYKQYSVKQGTIFEDSPLGLDVWLAAIWLISNAKNGISSYEIMRDLNVTQKTAWFLLHRIRLAMKTGTFEKLGNRVESDETFIGGLSKNMHKAERAKKITGTGGVNKTCVFGMIERGGDVIAMVVPDRSRTTLQNIILGNVEKGCQLFTDALSSYAGLDHRYRHEIIDHAFEYVNGEIHTNSIENFWALFKRCVKGTYVSIMPEHLDSYLDEEVFRFNERRMNDGDRFRKVASQISGKRIQYSELIARGR